VATLHLSRKHLGTSSDSPGDNGFTNGALLNSLNDAILLDTTDLTEQDEHLAVGIFLVAEEMIDESRARVTITTDGNTLVGAVGDEGEKNSLDMPPDSET
jgi:hypothetical protein